MLTFSTIIVGILIIIGISYLLSNDKKAIQWKTIGIAVAVQVVLAGLLILTPAWVVVEAFGNGVQWILDQALYGMEFVFGPLVDPDVVDGRIFFIVSLMPMVFLCALIGLLVHFGIIQKFIKVVAKFLAKVLRIDTIVAVNGVSNMFLGQSASLFVTKSQLKDADDNVVFATLVGGFTSISFGIIPAIIAIAGGALLSSTPGTPFYGFDILPWVIISIPLTVISTFTLTQIIRPTSYSEQTLEIDVEKKDSPLDTMMDYSFDGFKTVIGITVAVMVFIALFAMFDNLIQLIPFMPEHVTLGWMLGFVFYPITFLMGIPFDEIPLVSEILATRFVTNELVAYGLITPELTENTVIMLIIALCGFAGLGSVGIMIGTYQGVAPNKASSASRLGFLALVVATLVNILTAMIVGIFLLF